MLFRRLAAALFGLALLSAAAQAQDVRVLAAASTTNALTEIAEAFTKKTGIKVTPSFAASSTLAKQVENGAPGHVFLSADEKWMAYMEGKKLVVPETKVNLLGNKLALIAPAGSKVELTPMPNFPLAAALGDGRLAVGDPAHVPVGAYTQEALTKLGVWKDVEPKLARADSVRAALAFVERGEAPLGIVYTTDAAVTPKVRIVSIFPPETHAPIVYPAALIKGNDTPEARKFLNYLGSAEAKDVWAKFGFLVK